MVGKAEERPSIEKLTQLAREYAFASQPQLRRETEIRVRRYEINDLWENMKIDVFDIRYTTRDNTTFNEVLGFYYDGKVSGFGAAFGGYGLMSGLVHDGEFYYTCSWGSGIHRSLVGRLQVVDGKPKQLYSDPFLKLYLFASVGPDSKVHVFSGKYKAFNRWEASKEVGTIVEGKEDSSSKVQIVDAMGKLVEPVGR